MRKTCLVLNAMHLQLSKINPNADATHAKRDASRYTSQCDTPIHDQPAGQIPHMQTCSLPIIAAPWIPMDTVP